MDKGRDETKNIILRSLKAMFNTDQVIELRILGIGQREGFNAAGWFSNHEKLAERASSYDLKKTNGIYVTINEVNPACLARSDNEVIERIRTTTSDRDITKRRWLPIDIDPKRPAGISSTETELQKAKLKAEDIRHWMENEIKLSPGIKATSGNGMHLLYKIDMQNTPESKALMRACLIAIGKKFNTNEIQVDESTFNASRIWKLYGTTARKGIDMKERPNRKAELWKTRGRYPELDKIKLNNIELLEKIANTKTRKATGGKQRASKQQQISIENDKEYAVDLIGFMDIHNIKFKSATVFDGTGIKYILDKCLFDEQHTGSSAAIGRSHDGKVFYKCFHQSCTGKGWESVKKLYDAGNIAKTKTKQKKIDNENPWHIAKDFIDEEFTDADTGQIILRRHRETFYTYRERKRKYVMVSDNDIKMEIAKWLGDKVKKLTNKRVGDLYGAVCARITVSSEMEMPLVSKINSETGCTTGIQEKPNWITMQNGILDLDRIIEGKTTKESLGPLTPNWLSTISLPFPFPTSQEECNCQDWLSFLDEIMDGDQERINILQEAFGYCFVKDTRFEKFFVFNGAGRNGKSTVLSVLSEMLGPESTESLSPQQFADKYMVSRLAEKWANLCSDMSEVDRTEEGVLKAIVSGDRIVVDRKYKEGMQVKLRAKLFFATNILPRFTDTSLGIWRRMVVIPFNHIVPMEDINIYLIDKLKLEMPGIILWAIRGMKRLIEKNRFTPSKECTKAIRQYRMQCFPILTFVDECTQKGGQIYAGQLWGLYRKWCMTCGLKKPKPIHTFMRDIMMFKRDIEHVKPARGSESSAKIYGMSIKPNVDLELLKSGQALPLGGD